MITALKTQGAESGARYPSSLNQQQVFLMWQPQLQKNCLQTKSISSTTKCDDYFAIGAQECFFGLQTRVYFC